MSRECYKSALKISKYGPKKVGKNQKICLYILLLFQAFVQSASKIFEFLLETY